MLTVQALTWDTRDARLLVKQGVQCSFTDLSIPSPVCKALVPTRCWAGYMRLMKHNFDRGRLDLIPHRTAFKFVKGFTN